jgi:AraC family transcriptional regulator
MSDEAPTPGFFTFLRDSVGSGDIKGAREGWVAPAALYTGAAGIGESAWTTTTETLIALRLSGPAVEDHNRELTRRSGPGRDFALQPKGAPTRFLAQGPINFGHVFLPDALLDRACEIEDLPAISGRLRDDLSFVPETMLQALLAQYLRRAFDPLDPATSLEMEGRALLLVDRLLRLHGPSRGRQTLRTGGLSPLQLRRARDFIATQCARDIRLDDLAGLTGLSAKHFARAFRQSTGAPPHQYLIAQRIASAKQRLLDGKESLAEIALACGFSDQSHFTAAFRKAVGVPPGLWRRYHGG